MSQVSIPFYVPQGENNHEYAIFKRVPWGGETQYPVNLNEPVGDEIRCIVLDTETTGLTPNGVVIELAMADVRYSPSKNQWTSIMGVAKMFQDPGMPIPPEITKITGIVDDDVRGQSLDLAVLSQWFSGDPIIIAHNAGFDRPMLEKAIASKVSESKGLRWVCSVNDIAWKDMGFEGRGQRQLVFEHGGFYTAHEALSDVMALVWLLNENNVALKQLYDNMTRPVFAIKAVGAPFAVKDDLKAGGFQWGDEKVWTFSSTLGDDLKGAVALIDRVYGGTKTMRIEATDMRQKYTGQSGERVTLESMLASIEAHNSEKQTPASAYSDEERAVFDLFGLR